MLNTELEQLVNQLLNSADYKDYARTGCRLRDAARLKK